METGVRKRKERERGESALRQGISDDKEEPGPFEKLNTTMFSAAWQISEEVGGEESERWLEHVLRVMILLQGWFSLPGDSWQ